MSQQAPDRTKEFWRGETRLLVAFPVVFLLTAMATSSLGIELTLRALGPLPLSPTQIRAVQKVRLGLIGLGSVGALGLGLLLATAIAQPLRRMARMVRERIEPQGVAAPDAVVNELAELSNSFDHMLLSFDKFVTDSHVLEGMPEGVLVVNGQGRVKRTNAEARRLLELPGISLEGSELTRFPRAEVGQVLADAVREVRETGTVVELPSVAVIEPDEARTELSVTLAPFSGEGSGAVLVTLKDLSQIPKIRSEIRRVDQLAAVGAHVVSLAHELSGGLMAIQTLLDLLPVQEESEAYIKKLQEEVARAVRLIDEIRAFGRVTLRERTPCNVAELAGEALWLVQMRFLEKEIEVIKQLPADLPSVMGDRDRLTQSFMNIVTNAFEATPAGGTIKVIAERDGAEIIIRVANTGSYIPPGDQKQIFDLFHTTKKYGSGLGLPLARRTATDHNGEIEVESSPEAGTAFVIRLPAS